MHIKAHALIMHANIHVQFGSVIRFHLYGIFTLMLRVHFIFLLLFLILSIVHGLLFFYFNAVDFPLICIHSFSLAFNYCGIHIKALRKRIHIFIPDNTPHIFNGPFVSKRIVAMIQKWEVNCSSPAIIAQLYVEIKSKRKSRERKKLINKGFKHKTRTIG